MSSYSEYVLETAALEPLSKGVTFGVCVCVRM